MYPVLETARLLLKPLCEDDFDNMFKLDSDSVVVVTMEHDIQNDKTKYRTDFIDAVTGGEYLSIRKKETDDFIGYIGIHQYVNKAKAAIRYSQMWTAILPEYWGHGYCTEATRKLLHFAFFGVKTPWICANQFCDNPAAGKVLKKCGFSYYATYKMKNKPYDQYRYTIDNYVNNIANSATENEEYRDYVFQIKKSPYNYDNPIRKVHDIKYIKEPTGYLCGQSVVAMLADVSVDEVIDVMGTDKGTSVQEVNDALAYYGIKHAKTRKKYIDGTVLPDLCILSLKLPGYGHWSLYYNGIFYDPEFGVLKECPKNAKLCYYWELYV